MIEVIPNWHPLFVHFPIALISLSAFFHVVAILLRNQSRCAAYLAVLAHTSLWLGALSSLPTALLGWLAFNSVEHDEAGHAAMLAHRVWALATVLAVVVLAGWDAWRHKVDATPGWLFTSAVILAWALVASTAWHGAELVYRHGLGVISLPAHVANDAHEHGHMHEASPHPH
ncbi:MAG: DUF2231 domain-containing protein [Sideroxydans sp.]|nr:DUF2231 domain-containing protein [Sideroxydans sp.]